MSRIIEIDTCKECPYREYRDSMGHDDEGCLMCNKAKREIKFSDQRSGGNYDVVYYDFPKWCPLKEIGDFMPFAG